MFRLAQSLKSVELKAQASRAHIVIYSADTKVKSSPIQVGLPCAGQAQVYRRPLKVCHPSPAHPINLQGMESAMKTSPEIGQREEGTHS